MWVEDLLPVPDSTSPITGNESPLPYPEDMSENGGRITELTYTSGEGSNYIDLPMGGQQNAARGYPRQMKYPLNLRQKIPPYIKLILHTKTDRAGK